MIKWLYMAVAVLAGAAMALQGTMNAVLGKVVGLWESTLLVHAVGTVTVLAVLVLGGIGFSGLSKTGQAPWYVYMGGVLNVVIIYAVAKSIPQVGVGNATTAIVVAQTLTAVIIDHLGLMGLTRYPFASKDLLGIALMAVAARILIHNK